LPSEANKPRWGNPPWTIDFAAAPPPLPDEVDFAIVGGGFTGLAAAAWLKRLAPEKSVALFESDEIGAGASGHTGGMALAETAVGDLPGLGDVLQGFSDILRALKVDCDLTLPGAWELARKKTSASSPILWPISWNDSGNLRVAAEVPGGTIDPGKMVSGLARAAQDAGALIFERTRVEDVSFSEPLRLSVAGGELRTGQVLLATNAQSLELSGLVASTQPKFTLALATEPLTPGQLDELGLASGKPFYTVDFPYLWGRILTGGGVLFGSGLVHANDWRELRTLDVATGEAAELLARLEQRVRGLHPVLRSVEIARRWGGPILIGEDWQPVFRRHPRSPQAVVLGGYSGHGVALSVYLGRWAAEALLGQRELPHWDAA
jgi:glycine/D-amino acid oxidase-like deaminating enzyme